MKVFPRKEKLESFAANMPIRLPSTVAFSTLKTKQTC